MSRKENDIFPKIAGAVRLGDCAFSLASGELRDAGGRLLRLRPQSTEVLAHLVRQRGAVVPKAELFEAVWRGTPVTDDSLVQCISEIRRALGDRDRAIIQTASKKGYRAVAAPVAEDAAGGAQAPTVAVLAFEDFSAGEERGFLSDGIAEGVTAELSKFPELAVVARNSSFSFRDRPTKVPEISKALGARYLLEGSQQKSGGTLRVTAQLIDSETGHHLWAQSYERRVDRLIEAQNDIVGQIVATVAQKVMGAEGRGAGHAGERSALLHHLEARRHLIRFTPEDNEKARQANLAAIRADPTQPYGYAGLAFVLINGHRWGWTDLAPDEALAQARRAAQKALELGPDYYDGHAAMAYVHLEEKNTDRAIARAERALALNPNDTNVMCDLADFLGYAGRTEEAEVLLRKAMRLDPLHPDWIRWNLAWVLWLKGECVDALRVMEEMLEVPPMANRVLAVINVCLGKTEAARAAIAALLDFDPGYSLEDVRRDYEGKFKDQADLDRVLDSLREAGLPEMAGRARPNPPRADA